jgi:peptidoglycan hydrolase-like protein with peptidoglycan-binding domain
MSTATTSVAATLNSQQRDWLKKMGAALGSPGKSTDPVEIPLAGVFPEVIWEQKQPSVKAAESMLKELADTQLPNIASLRAEMDSVRSLERGKSIAGAIKAFDALEPKIKSEYERLLKARGSGVKIDAGPQTPKGQAKGSAAAKGAGGPATVPASSPAGPNAAKYQKEILKVGSKGPAVECLQKLLGGGLGVDGKFGPATHKAVKAVQKRKGLKDDGVVGPKTWAALGGGAAAGGGAGAPAVAGKGVATTAATIKSAGAGTAAGPSGTAKAAAAGMPPAKGPAKFITASVGKGGKNLPEDVKAVQAALNQRGGAKLPTDGKFSPQVLKAIEAFQKKLGKFKPDGLIEPNRGTARALSGAAKIPPTPPEPKPIAPPDLGKATLDKGAFVWHSTRSILNTNIEELKKGVRAAYGTEHTALLKAIDDSMVKLGKVVDKLDTRLADALDAAYKAPSDQARVPELKKAEGIMKEYLKYVKAEPLIGHMDNNPFGVKTSLLKVITDALKHLAQLLPSSADAKT